MNDVKLNGVETWKPVVGYEGRYEVSDLGRVCRIGGGRGARVGRVLSASPFTGTHYPKVSLYSGQRNRRNHMVHTLVLTAFVGPRPDGMECRHLDGNGANNALTNLQWGTPLENSDDQRRHGTRIRGERHFAALLTADDVREIHTLGVEGKSTAEIAVRLGVSKQAVNDILAGRRWGHLHPGPEAVAARAAARSKEECAHGHAYTPENTIITKKGWRVCKACDHAKQKAYRDRKRAAA